jgi:uroporphyrinogen-III decarboxylase
MKGKELVSSALGGNIDPVGVLLEGTPADVEESARSLIEQVRRFGRRRFVLSSGCILAPGTPEANLRALFNTARSTPLFS